MISPAYEIRASQYKVHTVNMDNAIIIQLECNIISKKWSFNLFIGTDEYYMGRIFHSEPIYNNWYECQKAAHKMYIQEMKNARNARIRKIY